MSLSLPGNIRILRRKSLVGQLVLLVLGVELLILASFTSLTLVTPTQRNLEGFINQAAKHELAYLPEQKQALVLNRFPVLKQPAPPIRTSSYVPIVPAAVLVGYFLGAPLGFLATAMFVVLGLIGPKLGFFPFAAGGGFDYITQPSFGYLIGLILGALVSGRITESAVNSVRQLAATFGGLFAVHACGLAYLTGCSLVLIVFKGEHSYFDWLPWLFESIRNFTWYPLPYDCLFALAAVGLGFPLRYVNSILAAPESQMRVRPKWDQQLDLVS